jgi:hypothetical protein
MEIVRLWLIFPPGNLQSPVHIGASGSGILARTMMNIDNEETLA